LPKKIIFDASVLVSGNITGNLYKTGLYRVSYEILKEMAMSNEIELYFFDIFQRERELIKYVHKEFPQCNIIKVHSAWYRLLIFPLGNLVDYLRNIQQSNDTGIISGFALVLKNILCLVEKLSRKIDRIFFINKNLTHSFDECSLYYSTYFPIPEQIRSNPKIKKVYTVHDIIPIIHPEYFSSSFNSELVKEVIDHIEIEDYVIAVSESTKNDILEFRPDLLHDHIVVSLLAASLTFRKEYDEEKIEIIKNKYKIYSNKYILSVCTLEPRKNLRLLVNAYKSIIKDSPDFSLKLVLIGSYGWDSNELLNEIKEINSIYNNPIILTGYVPDAELAALYSGAELFAYPSLYEGFGLPVLEAMQCGVPVICSNNSSLPEIVGDCGLLIDPSDVNDLIKAILIISNNQIVRQNLSEKSEKRAQLFSWEKTTQIIIENLEKHL